MQYLHSVECSLSVHLIDCWISVLPRYCCNCDLMGHTLLNAVQARLWTPNHFVLFQRVSRQAGIGIIVPVYICT